jgi:tRNA pseudouridine13 synthase
MAEREESDRPLKRLRLEEAEDGSISEEAKKEIRSGITAFISPGLPGFSGVLKQRYTDFLVNEVLMSGEVLHLEDTASGPSGGQRNQQERAKHVVKDQKDGDAETQASGNPNTAKNGDSKTAKEEDQAHKAENSEAAEDPKAHVRFFV